LEGQSAAISVRVPDLNDPPGRRCSRRMRRAWTATITPPLPLRRRRTTTATTMTTTIARTGGTSATAPSTVTRRIARPRRRRGRWRHRRLHRQRRGPARAGPGGGQLSARGTGFIENKHSTDVESSLPPAHVCMSICTQKVRCSPISVECFFSMTLLQGARREPRAKRRLGRRRRA
jgi:hypothetical protein